MKAASVLVSTFGIWLVAKQRTAKYWALTSRKNTASKDDTDSIEGSGNVAPVLSLPSLPDLTTNAGLQKAGKQVGLDIIYE